MEKSQEKKNGFKNRKLTKTKNKKIMKYNRKNKQIREFYKEKNLNCKRT